jgi:ankyrin repeat protein
VEVVRALLDRGADIEARDNLKGIPLVASGGGGATPLIEAAKTGDITIVKLLLERGANINAADANGGTALTEAVIHAERETVRLLLDKGASVKVRTGALAYPVLAMAAMRGDVEIARVLLEKGAEVNAADTNGMTPLMWAASNDAGNQELVGLLLAAGADPKMAAKSGETALTAALRRGETPVAAILRKAGAPAGPTLPVQAAAQARGGMTEIRSAIGHAVAAMAKSSPVSFKRTGCATCHHQTLPAMAMVYARKAGVEVEEKSVAQQVSFITAMMKPAASILAEASDVVPDIEVTGPYMLEALDAAGYKPDMLTAAVVHKVAMRQMADGRWVGWAPRPPLESGDIQATAMAIRALTIYGMPGRRAEFAARIARGRAFLERAVPATMEEYTMKLFGLAWAGAAPEDIAKAARAVEAMQRPDGGWAQLPMLVSDAYATGKALVALREAAGYASSHAAVERGVRFLRATQYEDGTWMVRTRAFPFQPLVDTEFPHGRDQWISMAGTAWAVMALSSAQPSQAPPTVAAVLPLPAPPSSR